MDWYAEMWFLRSKMSLSREGGQDLSVACLRSMPSVAVRGVRMAHAKKQRRKENREPVCVMRGAVTRGAVGFAVGG
jgi:hypothetical protein